MRSSWIIAAVIAIGSALWIATGQVEELRVNEAPSGPDRSKPIVDQSSVRIATTVAEPWINTLSLQGRTISDRHVTVRAETSGRVEQILVERGTRVAEGQELLRLAVNEREARLTEARALLRQRELEHAAAEQLNERGYRADTAMAEAEAALTAARAAVRVAEIELGHTAVKAPFSGIVDDRWVEIGDYVQKGSDLAELVDLDPLRVRGELSERQCGRVREGAAAQVRFLDGRMVEGRVVYIGTVANSTTRTVPIDVEIANADFGIIEGVTAELILPLSPVMAHRISPAFLSLADDGQLGVKAVDRHNRVVFHPVDILGDTAEGIWLAGLPDILRVITVGHQFVVPGQAVRPVSVDDQRDTVGTAAVRSVGVGS